MALEKVPQGGKTGGTGNDEYSYEPRISGPPSRMLWHARCDRLPGERLRLNVAFWQARALDGSRLWQALQRLPYCYERVMRALPLREAGWPDSPLSRQEFWQGDSPLSRQEFGEWPRPLYREEPRYGESREAPCHPGRQLVYLSHRTDWYGLLEHERLCFPVAVFIVQGRREHSPILHRYSSGMTR